jgi:hypothetical protein
LPSWLEVRVYHIEDISRDEPFTVDIYRVPNGQISDNWHLEDNLSLMQ